MKAIQVTFDEGLLRRLDDDPEVKREGRSAVLRRAAAEYLKRRRSERIDARLERGYRKQPPRDLEGWAGEGVWPEE